jgi:hypothetical protein
MTRTELLNAYLIGHEIVIAPAKHYGQPVVFMPRTDLDPQPWLDLTRGFRWTDEQVTSDDADEREAFRLAALNMAVAQGYVV